MSDGKQPLLRMRGISKSFSGVQVLESVDLDVYPGEVHILAGENGAGKSTLIKILGGVHTEYGGSMELEGRELRLRSPRDANEKGITVIHQEMSLIGSMGAADNVFLGREITSAGMVNHRAQHARTRELLQEFSIDIDVETPVENFALSVQQMIEIAKALSFEARIIVMDEPTSALTEPEVERLFTLIEQLKSRGCGIIYISHKMQEIYKIAQRITILRDGKHVGSGTSEEIPAARLVAMMVGREMTQQFPVHECRRTENVTLTVNNLSITDRAGAPRRVVDGVSFRACKGEILGIAGLQGSGNSELLNALFGVYGKPSSGTVELVGKRLAICSPRAAVKQGLALLTNDRKTSGLVLNMSIIHNTTLASLPAFSPLGWLLPRKEVEAADERGKELRLRAATLEQEVGSLSGGNQQKVVLAKWLETKPRLLMLDEPTRGVDVGAKAEIYDIMNQLRESGCTILLITSEMPELLAMSDRILVMHRGRITAEFERAAATQEGILQAAMGLEHEAAA